MKILVVDDIAYSRLSLERALTASGYEVLTATDGFTALEIIEQQANLSAVICDLVIPKLDGIDLLKACHNLERYRNMGGLLAPAFILATATDNVNLLEDAERGGFTYILNKPFDHKRLLEKLNAIEAGEHLNQTETKHLEILAIDPTDEIINAVTPIIDGTDNTLIHAKSFEEGLQLFQTHQNTGVVVINFDLHNKDGLTFYKACCEMERFNDSGPITVPPFILWANQISNDELMVSIKLGIKEVLVKPFDHDRLKTKLTEIYKERQTTSKTDKQTTEKRILVVDDIGFNRSMVEKALEKEGYLVKGVGSGEAALAQFKDYQQYDLVVCDLMMPDIDGIELYKDIQFLASQDKNKLSDQKVTCPPFILVTSCTEDAQLDEALAVGFKAVLQKPLNVSDLKIKVGSQLIQN